MTGPGYPPYGWRRTSELLDRHLARTGGREAASLDPMAQLQLAVLRDVLAIVHSACDDEGLDPDTTRRIVDRVIYGGMPSLAQAEYAQRAWKSATEVLARGLLIPAKET